MKIAVMLSPLYLKKASLKDKLSKYFINFLPLEIDYFFVFFKKSFKEESEKTSKMPSQPINKKFVDSFIL